ncbi:MAG: DUF502 domain-containing protein, partial [Elusimicrobiota bacterium]|nr:DUF502 domain-containing protein [Elusimicrobiota bacterium]
MENNTEPKRTIKERLLKILKNYLTLGIVIIIPLWLTFFVASILFDWVSNFTYPIFNAFTPEKQYAQIITKVGSFFISIILVCLLGFFANKVFGKNVLGFFEHLIGKIPIIGTVYLSAKQFINFIFSSDKTKGFKQVVLVPYPNEKSYSVAFLTNTLKINGEEHVCTFMPTTPNPSTGFLMMYKEKDIIHTNYSIDQAFQFIISVGVIGLDDKHSKDKPV